MVVPMPIAPAKLLVAVPETVNTPPVVILVLIMVAADTMVVMNKNEKIIMATENRRFRFIKDDI